MGASKKPQMKTFATDWADQMFRNAANVNNGKGAAWILALCAIAVTGARPAALEKGIQYSIEERDDGTYLVAKVLGVKLKKDSGQPWYCIMWKLGEMTTHRPRELLAILSALHQAPDSKLTIQYDAEAISTRLRELSRSIWPRKKYHISAYSYREGFAKAAKMAGVGKTELARAMGHISEASQRQYAGRRKPARSGKIPRRPFDAAVAAKPVKKERPQMERFKVMTLRKKNAASKPAAMNLSYK